MDKLITAILTFISAPILSSIYKSVFKKRFDGISRYKSTADLVEKNSKGDFYDDFSLDFFRESDFYLKTGIKTNAKTIEKYIRFKEKLGRNYTWGDVKMVKSHLSFDSEEIEINLNKFDRIFGSVVSILSLSFFVISLVLIILVGNISDDFILRKYLLMVLVFVFPALTGFFMYNGVISIEVAKKMEKVINFESEKNEYLNGFKTKFVG